MLLDSQPEQIRGRTFTARAGEMPGGRIEIFKRPEASHQYCVGADFAYGVGRDYDTAVVFDKTDQHEGRPAEQVAELQGHWGPNFHAVLFALLTFYNGAFLVGERQVGLFTLRRLWDEYGYRFMYVQRGEDKAAKVKQANASLGIHNGSSDLILGGFRSAIAQRKVTLRSKKLIEQMDSTHYVPRRLEEEGQVIDGDHRLAIKVMSGGSPDLVWAAAYGVFALSNVHLFDDPRPMFPKGSYGDLMGFEKDYKEVMDRQQSGGSYQTISQGAVQIIRGNNYGA